MTTALVHQCPTCGEETPTLECRWCGSDVFPEVAKVATCPECGQVEHTEECGWWGKALEQAVRETYFTQEV